jgi:RES domain-containing protein
MAAAVRSRDSALIDAIEALAPVNFDGRVWSIAREGRDPLQVSASGGRWDDGTFDVLYTSADRQGASEEMRFHLMRGQPVLPGRISFKLFELRVQMDQALRLADLEALAALGLDASTFGRLSWQFTSDEYLRTQQIGEVAHFLDFDGLIVPSARYQCLNMVLFGDRIGPEALSVIRDHGPVPWDG